MTKRNPYGRDFCNTPSLSTPDYRQELQIVRRYATWADISLPA